MIEHIQLKIDFTNREFEIINLLAEGNRAKDIASELFVSEFTVRTHLKNILRKSHGRNTTAVVATCIRQGLI